MTPEELLAAGFSPDEINAYQQEASQPVEGGPAIGDVIAGGLEKLIPGYGDEAVAGGNALLDAFVGGPGYDARLEQARGAKKAFEQYALPGTSTALDIGSFIGAPAAKAPGLMRMALEGGAYGFGEGEGGTANRLTDALTGGIANTVMGKGLSKTGEVLQGAFPQLMNKLGSAAEQSALAITAAERAKAIKRKGATYNFQQKGIHPIDEAVETAKAQGITKGELSQDALLGKATDKLNDTANAINDVLQQGEAVRPKNPIQIDFSNVENYIKKNAPGTDRDKFLKELAREKEAIQGESASNLLTLHQEKMNWQSKSYSADTNDFTKQVDRQITRALEQAIEKEIGKLSEKGVIEAGSLANFKKYNKIYGDLKRVQDIWTPGAAKEGAQDIFKKVLPYLRTSGGVGTGILSAMYSGDPLLGALIGVGTMAATSPRGRMVEALGARKLGSAAGSIGKGLENNVSPLSRALLASTFGG